MVTDHPIPRHEPNPAMLTHVSYQLGQRTGVELRQEPHVVVVQCENQRVLNAVVAYAAKRIGPGDNPLGSVVQQGQRFRSRRQHERQQR